MNPKGRWDSGYSFRVSWDGPERAESGVCQKHMLPWSLHPSPSCPGLGISLVGCLAAGSIKHLPWQPERKTQLMIMTYPLLPSQESSICAVGWHPCQASDGLSIQLPQPAVATPGLHPGPLAETGCNVSNAVSSGGLSAVGSEADRKCSLDLPSFACLKTMTLLHFMEEATKEF